MAMDRGMDKENVVHIHNGVLFSRKKDLNQVICRNVDRPRESHKVK